MVRILFIFLMLFCVQLNSQTLGEFIAIAKQNNYQIAINNARHNIARERVNEVGNYEHTEFSLGVFALTPETRVGSQILSLGASQKLPWFGVLESKKKLQNAIASAKVHDTALSERELVYQVKIAYYELYQKQVLSLIYDDNKQILSTYENMSLAALENNKASMSDVLKIRIHKNELHSKTFQNINTLESLSKNFNRLLQRPENVLLYITDSLNVLDILLTNNLIDKHPAIEKINARKTIYKSELDMINKDKAPKVNVGVDYVLIKKFADYNGMDNGKDILMPRLSIAFPLLNKKEFLSQENQIKLKEKMLEDEIENQKKILEIELEKAKLKLENAILSVVAAQKNKEETQRAINLDLKAYETGLLNYEKVLGLQLQKIKYEILEIEAVLNAFVAQAIVEYLTE